MTFKAALVRIRELLKDPGSSVVYEVTTTEIARVFNIVCNHIALQYPPDLLPGLQTQKVYTYTDQETIQITRDPYGLVGYFGMSYIPSPYRIVRGWLEVHDPIVPTTARQPVQVDYVPMSQFAVDVQINRPTKAFPIMSRGTWRSPDTSERIFLAPALEPDDQFRLDYLQQPVQFQEVETEGSNWANDNNMPPEINEALCLLTAGQLSAGLMAYDPEGASYLLQRGMQELTNYASVKGIDWGGKF